MEEFVKRNGVKKKLKRKSAVQFREVSEDYEVHEYLRITQTEGNFSV